MRLGLDEAVQEQKQQENSNPALAGTIGEIITAIENMSFILLHSFSGTSGGL